MLKQVKNILPRSSLQTLYYALIHSHLSYGLLAWGNAKSSFLQPTIKLQKYALRLITNSKYNDHTEPLFKTSNILKLNDLYTLEVMKFMHDYMHFKLPTSFNKLFIFNHELRNTLLTRQSNLLHIINPLNRFANALPVYHFPKIWNNISQSVNYQSYSKAKLKSHIKHSIISSYASCILCKNKLCKTCNK